jgi:hypothetical protein
MFAGKAEAYPSEAHFRYSTLGLRIDMKRMQGETL